jgi:RNA methyltransferase, TrmH family
MKIYLHSPSKLWNIALITRTLKLFGHDELYVFDDANVPLNKEAMTPTQVRRANKMSVGAYFQMKVHRVEDPVEFVRNEIKLGHRILASVPAIEATPLNQFQFEKNDVLLLGAEAYGLPQEIQDFCTNRITIPSPGSSYSFNLGVAAGILLYEYGRQHQF